MLKGRMTSTLLDRTPERNTYCQCEGSFGVVTTFMLEGTFGKCLSVAEHTCTLLFRWCYMEKCRSIMNADRLWPVNALVVSQ